LRPLCARLNRLRRPLDAGLDCLCRPTDAGLGRAGDPIQTSLKGHRAIRRAALIYECETSCAVGWQLEPCSRCERHIVPKRGVKPLSGIVRGASETYTKGSRSNVIRGCRRDLAKVRGDFWLRMEPTDAKQAIRNEEPPPGRRVSHVVQGCSRPRRPRESAGSKRRQT